MSTKLHKAAAITITLFLIGLLNCSSGDDDSGGNKDGDDINAANDDDGGGDDDSGGSASVGAACDSNADCGGDGVCVTEEDPSTGETSEWRDGYCTVLGCSPDAQDCPGKAVCLGEDNETGVCFAACDPLEEQCREGYICVDIGQEEGICIPACRDDLCEEAMYCSEETLLCEPVLTEASVGGECDEATENEQCGVAGICLTSEDDWPDGYCIAYGCDEEVAEKNCPEGALCLGEQPDAVCLDGCADDTDCRDEYICSEAMVCQPRCLDDADCLPNDFCAVASGQCRPVIEGVTVGASCSNDSDCGINGLCVTDSDGWPEGFCLAADCDESYAQSSCPDNSACVAAEESGIAVCMVPCETDDQCRDEYLCFGGFCMPGCQADSDCPQGDSCDAASGRCYSDLSDVPVGAACRADQECGSNGACLQQESSTHETIWKGGYCTGFFCDEISACPDGSSCYQLADVTMCLDECLSASQCREGYDCLTIEEATASVCLP